MSSAVLPAAGDLTSCFISMRTNEHISFGEANRRLQSMRRIFEGLLIRRGLVQTNLPNLLRDTEPRAPQYVAIHNTDIELEERSRRQRAVDLSIADEIWSDTRRVARRTISEIPVSSIKYGSPYEVVLAIQHVAQPANVAILATAVIALKIPQIINSYSRIPADREKAKLDRETYAAQRAELRKLVPVENADFRDLPTRRAELEVADRLQRDETSILNALSRVQRVVTTTGNLRLDSSDAATMPDSGDQ